MRRFFLLTISAATASLAACDDDPTLPDACVPAAEDCNGADDDCDGLIDEGEGGGPLRRTCSTACGTGLEECEGGVWRYCSAAQPSTELCDGNDNDCDGQIDEGCECRHGERESCGIDVGVCEPGVRHCEAGQWGDCLLPYDPDDLVEICNDGLDNDCDGDTDEDCACTPGDTQPCGVDEGECSPGTMTCNDDSEWDPLCVGAVEPVLEACDELDNDCDGEIDFIVAADFGWARDAHEPNDSCADASPMYNDLGHAELLEGAGWLELSVSDSEDLNTYPTLYPPGDTDWYHVRAIEASHSCVPLASQCAFRLSLQLWLADELIEESWVAPEDYQLCVSTGECAEGTGGDTVCTHVSDWSDEHSSYLLSVIWGGRCGSDDSRDVNIQVRSPTEAACGHYQLFAIFELDEETDCP